MTGDADGPAVTLILDRTALLGYAAGSMHVAETIHEVLDSGSRVGVPVAAAVEALAVVPGAERSALDWLLGESWCQVLPSRAEDWAELAFWRDRTGRYDHAAAVLAALQFDALVLSSDVKAYGSDGTLPVVYFPA